MSNTVKLPICPKCSAPIPLGAPQGLCPKCVLRGAATATEQGVPATATSEIPSIERIAAAFPQLEILELIGRGGMGFVFKARQPHLDRFVALKLLPDKLAKDPQFAERFNREGRVLAKLSHPNIVSVFDFGQTGGFYYLLMEYIDGVNLRQAMRAGRFSPAEALSIVPKICEALQYAHEQGILHRDIKPENILLDAKGRVKIADFGIAKLVGEEQSNITLTNTGAALGTPHYMAPEQLEKPSTVDHRADIYSLGVVFYEMLTGELPIGRFAPPSAKTPISERVDAIVFRALEKERELRQKDAGEFKTQVEQAAAEPPLEPAPAPAVAPRWVKPVAILFLALGATAVPPTLLSIGTSAFVLNLFMFMALTGVALLTRNPIWRRVALGVNTIGVLWPWLSAFNIAAAMQNGALAFDWKSGFLPNHLGLAILFAFLETCAFGAGLWVLLRSDVKALFELPAHRQGRKAATSVPPFSGKAIWGVTLVGLSVLAPVLLAGFELFRAGGTPTSSSGSPGLLTVALLFVLPALAGTILGWIALSDINAHQGQLRGAPLAVFAALAWPGLAIVGLTVWLVVGPVRNLSTTSPFAGFLLLLIPAGMLTFLIWGVFATAQKATGQSGAHRRGVLKWIFISLLLAGMGALVMPPKRSAPGEGSDGSAVDVATPPRIQFTFTTVELREEDGARWLAMDFVEQTRGDCERFLRYAVSVPGFTAQTRTTSFRTEAKAGFAPVLHQRISWKLPDSLPAAEAEALRDLVAKERIGKPLVLDPDEEYPLFKTVVPSGGSLVAAIGVKFKSDETSSNPQRKTAPWSKNAASAELWAPKPASGEKPKPSEILQEAKSLAQKGRYEEALQRQIWYHNHALEIDRAQNGVRLSFALSSWTELARRYPKAKDALVEVRDRGTHEFEQGGGYFDLFMEVAAINRVFDEQDATVALFKSIDARDPKLARQCYFAAEDVLLERGDYSLCARFIPSFQQRFDRSFDTRKRTLSLVDRTPEANGGQLRKQADRSFIKDSRTLIEILVAIGRKDEADNIRDQALTILNVPELRTAVEDADARIKSVRGQAGEGATVPSANPAPAQNHSFGPVIVRTLSFNESLQDAFLDLETGQLLTPPKDLAALFKTDYAKRVVWENESDPRAIKMQEWLRASGANLMAWGGESGERLEMREGFAMNPPWMGTGRPIFDQTDPGLVASQAESDLRPLLLNNKTLLEPKYDPQLGRRQDTFQFLTREGTIGVLQILNRVDNPPGLRIRYKLVKTTAVATP